jgi:hypothetical protein
MKALQAYIDKKNQWNRLFKGKEYEIQTSKGRQEVADSLDADLSPENLSCDGELSRTQINARYKALMSAATQLQKLDPSVRIYEFG